MHDTRTKSTLKPKTSYNMDTAKHVGTRARLSILAARMDRRPEGIGRQGLFRPNVGRLKNLDIKERWVLELTILVWSHILVGDAGFQQVEPYPEHDVR